MTEAEKAPYKNKAETDTTRYREAMVAWKAGDMAAGGDDVHFVYCTPRGALGSRRIFDIHSAVSVIFPHMISQPRLFKPEERTIFGFWWIQADILELM